jgi:hypothetical protein
MRYPPLLFYKKFEANATGRSFVPRGRRRRAAACESHQTAVPNIHLHFNGTARRSNAAAKSGAGPRGSAAFIR